MKRQAPVKVEGAKGPASLGTGRILLSKISKKRGVSGHRIPHESHKVALKQDLLENGWAFGKSLPTIMESTDTDGLHLIDDGLQLVEVLAEIEAEKHTDLHVTLKDIFEHGVPCEWVKWEDDHDRPTRVKYQAMRHDESNVYKHTSIDQIKEVMKQFQREAGSEDPEAIKKCAAKFFGKGKLRTLGRWADTLAVPDEVMPAINAVKKWTNSYIYGNEFFVDKGTKQLSIAGMKHSLSQLNDDQCAGMTIKPEEFKQSYCRANRGSELWLSKLGREAPPGSCNIPQFDRVTDFLRTDRGRKQVLACLNSNTPLHGSSDENPGVPDCRALYKTVHGKASATSGSTGTAGKIEIGEKAADGAAVICDGADSAAAGAATAAAEEVLFQSLYNTTVQNTGVRWADMDEAFQQILSLANSDMDLVEYAHSVDVFVAKASERLVSGRPLLVVDCPSSAIRVVSQYLDIVKQLDGRCKLERFTLMILTGNRFSMMAAVQSKCFELWPDSPQFMVQLNAGPVQNVGALPRYALVVEKDKRTAQDVTPLCIPAACQALKLRSFAHEGVRQVCMDRNCKHRSAAPEDAGEHFEIHEDDRQENLFDEMLNAEETEDAKEDLAVTALNSGPKSSGTGKKAPRRRLWPHASSESFYTKILKDIGRSESATVLLSLSSTAHPGLIVAARGVALPVVCLLDRPSSHSIGHGKDLALELLFRKHFRLHQAKEGHKQVRSPSLYQYVEVNGSVEEGALGGTQVKDAVQDVDFKYAGWDLRPSDLVVEWPKLLQKDLVENRLHLSFSSIGDAGRSLCTNVSRIQGDVVLECLHLVYKSEASLQDFIETPGNDFFLPYLGLVTNVPWDDETCNLHVLFLGAAAYVNDFTGIRQQPNCALVFKPEKGPTKGMLQLVVTSKQGISAGKELVIDYGKRYDHQALAVHTKDQNGPALKKMKGALDTVFETQHKQAASVSANAVGVAGKEVQRETLGGKGPEQSSAISSSLPSEKGASQPSAKAAGKGAAPSPAGSAKCKENLEAQGGKLLAEFSNPPCCLFLVPGSNGKGTLSVCDSGSAANKNLKKDSVLYRWGSGDLTVAKDNSPALSWQPTPGLTVWHNGATKKLSNAIKDCKGLYGVVDASTPKWQLEHTSPPIFKSKDPKENALYQDLVKATEGLRCAGLVWEVKLAKDGRLIPVAIVLLQLKQITVPGNSSIQLD
eukprot:TRINITY_DN4115_c0_g1_i1.p1 TRINITY_DN4115_c0_g1~~TRINITY_DN4115_c0_g1_i1.p1  ORF type:complete len:1197 (+),score=255.68 TRINITY_DN4115_c0_g1_i1:122-3712(+)